jgi:hypothetical protein
MQQQLQQHTTPNQLSVPALALLGVFGGIVAVHLGVILFVLGLDSLDMTVSHALAVTAAQATVVLAWLLISAASASLLVLYTRSVSAERARLRLTHYSCNTR